MGGTDNDTTYTVASPLQKNSSNQISINQDGFNLTTSITANDEILFFDTSDNFDKITFSNFKTAVNYGATAPISLVGSNYTYDISSLADATLALTDNLFIQQGANLKKTTLTAIKTLISPTIPANTISNGKTGLTTYTKGDILYYNTGTALSKLPIGSAGKSLIVSATGIPMWGNAVVNTNAPISTNSITDNIELDFTNLTESDINDNDYLLLNLSTNSTSFYKKKYYTFRNSIALPVNLPLKKVSVGGQNEDELSFTISQLGASNGSLTSTVIIAEGGNDASFRQLNLSQLGDVVIPAGVNFGTDTSISANHRTFGANSRFLNLNGSQINFKINGTTKMSYITDTFTIEPVNTAELRVAHTTDTNAMTNVDTECCISSIKDLHLFTPGTNFANSKNRIVFIAGGSQALVGIFGYCGNNTSVANGGIPNPANSNNPMGSNFIMTQGNDNTFAVCNRVSNSFSTTFTQFTIKNQETNFWTDTVKVNGSNGLMLNANAGGLDTGATVNMKIRQNGAVRIAISASNQRVMIGEKASDIAGFPPKTALHICNNSSSSSANECRIAVETRLTSYEPGYEMWNNSGFWGLIKFDASGNIQLSTQSNSRYTIINNRIQTKAFNYFLNQNGSSGWQLYTSANSIGSTGSHFWRQNLGSSGNLDFYYSTRNGSWGARAYIYKDTSGFVQMNFTGQHRCVPKEEDLYDNVDNYIGMIVEATGEFNSIDYEDYYEDVETIDYIGGDYDDEKQVWNIEPDETIKTTNRVKKTRIINSTEPTINEAQPIVQLTTSAKSKKVYGVISNKEDSNDKGQRVFLQGNWGSVVQETKSDNRLFINSIGEGGILVCNENGNIENGDYLCSSSITGIAMKQDDDILHNYTLAKATQDYNFVDSNERKLIGCSYHCG